MSGPQQGPAGAARIIAALDVPDPAAASVLAGKLDGHVGMFKVGLELFVAHGRAALVRPGAFLDLKLHDIPQTVESAARGVAGLSVAMLTVHASGGAAMIAAARRGLDTPQAGHAGQAGHATQPAGATARTRLLAVTVLTSLGEDDLDAVGLRGPAADAVLRLGTLAIKAGADGLVCSPAEVALLRRELGPGPLLVVPGIRPAGSAASDQRRTGTPREAVEAGATYLVIGRPLRDAANPAEAADAIAADLD